MENDMQSSTFAGSASTGAGARGRAPRRDAGREGGAPAWLALLQLPAFVAALDRPARHVVYCVPDPVAPDPIHVAHAPSRLTDAG
ncbi:hypothetical protein CF642_39405, partial [Burkholderia pseudomallei]